MNVFEDLIDELKEENLIESTVADGTGEDAERLASKEVSSEPRRNVAEQPASRELKESLTNQNHSQPNTSTEDGLLLGMATGNVLLPEVENDYYRRRAMEEVASLQMVERIFSAVEREQLKVLPKTYDDIPVSKALHDFLQVTKGTGSSDNASAEFRLMQETESWYSALTHRDQNILPAHLRRYCETTRPALSSQALASLARFYRNSPFSEGIRSKFDLIITRFFSKDAGDLREIAFPLEEISNHLAELYADWASVSVYAADDDSELSLLALKFEDFISEAELATSFEELVRSDFFNRVRALKESAGENFYAPQVAASVVKCNVIIGNRYVELLNHENSNANAALRLEDKYGYLLDQTVSEAASKTFQLVKLLHAHEDDQENKAEAQPKIQRITVSESEFERRASAKKAKRQSAFQSAFAVNKWLLILMFVTILGCVGLYSWVEFALPKPSTENVVTLEINDEEIAHFVRVAKITNNTLIGLAATPWDEATEVKKQQILSNLLNQGKTKGFNSVRLLSNEGRTVGYLSADNITQSDIK